MLYTTPDSQASAMSSDLFMIRGDGQTTATNVGGIDTPASAMIVEASSEHYSGGTVLISRTTAKTASSDFFLFKVICVSILFKVNCLTRALVISVQASAVAADKLVVRGDGETTMTTAEANVSAVIAKASAASYTGTVMEVKTTGTTDGVYTLFKVVSSFIFICLLLSIVINQCFLHRRHVMFLSRFQY
jgi:hypothetical protein